MPILSLWLVRFRREKSFNGIMFFPYTQREPSRIHDHVNSETFSVGSSRPTVHVSEYRRCCNSIHINIRRTASVWRVKTRAPLKCRYTRKYEYYHYYYNYCCITTALNRLEILFTFRVHLLFFFCVCVYI